MKFRVKYDPEIDKLVWVYEIFAPPTSSARKYHILRLLYLIPETRSIAELGDAIDQIDTPEFWEKAFSGKLELGGLLAEIRPPEPNPDNFAWISELDNSEFCNLVKSWFNLDCPDSIDVYISSNLPNQIQGTSYPTREPRISISAGKNAVKEHKKVLRVMYHEVLHSLLRLNEYSNEQWPGDAFEECLLDFFVPKGHLAFKLGLISSKRLAHGLEEMKARSTRRSKWYSDWLGRLYPILSKFEGGNVWDLLAENANPEDPLWEEYLEWYKERYKA